MSLVDPIHGEPAAVVALEDERLLVVADYHAGFEIALRYEEGIELRSRASERRTRLLDLVASSGADRLVILGDLTHSIGGPGSIERDEVGALIDSVEVPITITKGNHDGILEEFLATDPARFGGVEVTSPTGVRMGPIAFAHGHTWPTRAVLKADVFCIGHEHPCVHLRDEVGGSRIEQVWLRGRIVPDPFIDRGIRLEGDCPQLVVVPAFNELCGGTWVNVPEQDFLAPFLPEALPAGDVYLLDGTHLGDYHDC